MTDTAPDTTADTPEIEAVEPPRIAEGLLPLAVDIDKIRPQERNARVGDVDMVRGLLRRFGQRKPITVTRDAEGEGGETSAGSTTLRAAIAEGMTQIAVVWFDDTPDEAKAWSLADNRAHEVGYTDEEIVEDMLAELAAVDGDLVTGAGFDLEAVLAELHIEPPAPPAEEPKKGFVPGRKQQATPPELNDDGGTPTPNQEPSEPAAPVSPQFPVGWPPGTFGAAVVEPQPDPDPETIAARNAAQEAADALPDDGPVLFLLGNLRATVDRAAFEEFRTSLMVEIPDREEAGAAVLHLLGFTPAAVHIVRRPV